MVGANPPSFEKCGRPAVVKWVGPFGETKYWCERCRRKHFPTEAEKIKDERTELRDDKIAGAVLSFIELALKVVALGVCIYGLVAFVKWCWIHS